MSVSLPYYVSEGPRLVVQPPHGRRVALLHHHPRRVPDHPPRAGEAGPGLHYRGGSGRDLAGEDSLLLPGIFTPGVTRRKESSVQEPVKTHPPSYILTYPFHLPKPLTHHG